MKKIALTMMFASCMAITVHASTDNPIKYIGTCQCSIIDYYNNMQVNFVLEYNTFGGGMCNPCGAYNMNLTAYVFNPSTNDDYIYTGSPTLFAINFLCGSQCRPEDWLWTRSAATITLPETKQIDHKTNKP